MASKRQTALNRLLESKKSKLDGDSAEFVKRRSKRSAKNVSLPSLPINSFDSGDEGSSSSSIQKASKKKFTMKAPYITEKAPISEKVLPEANEQREISPNVSDDEDNISAPPPVARKSNALTNKQEDSNEGALIAQDENIPFLSLVKKFADASPETQKIMMANWSATVKQDEIVKEFVSGYKYAQQGSGIDLDLWTVGLGILLNNELEKNQLRKRISLLEKSTERVTAQLAYSALVDFSPENGDKTSSVQSLYNDEEYFNVSQTLGKIGKTTTTFKGLINKLAKIWINKLLKKEDIPKYTTSTIPHGYTTFPLEMLVIAKNWIISTVSVSPGEDRIDPERLPFTIGDAFERHVNYLFHQSRATEKKKTRMNTRGEFQEAQNLHLNSSHNALSKEESTSIIYSDDPYSRSPMIEEKPTYHRL